MSKKFDPYLQWLGIRSGGRKINHYRLLGLTLLESDLSVISAAANRQISHVLSFTDEHPEYAKKIHDELAAARDCLLNEDLKNRYDQKIKQAVAAKKKKAAVGAEAPNPGVSIDTKKSNQSEFKGINPGPIISAPQDSGVAANSVVSPKVQAKPQSKKKNRFIYDIAGWVLGAVAAVAFAWFILNSNFADSIRERIPFLADSGGEPVLTKSTAEIEVADEPEPKPETTTAKPKPGTNTNRVKPAKGSPPVNPKPRKKPESESGTPTGQLLTSSRNSSRPKLAFSAPVKQPVPDKASWTAALDEVKDEYRSELSGSDAAMKQLAARRILQSTEREEKPELRYANMVLATKLSAQAGDFDLIVQAVNKFNRLFDGDEFWQEISRPIGQAISQVRNFETEKFAFKALLAKINNAEEFELSATVVGKAGILAGKSGDLLQEELFKLYGKDLKGLAGLKKKYQAISLKANDQWTSKEKFDAGRYLCYGLEDWKQGLQLIAEGNDKAFASIAKRDLESGSGDGEAVARAWAKLSDKKKYQVVDRRFLLLHARDCLQESSLSSAETQPLIKSIDRQTAVFKNYVSSSKLRGKTIEFDVKGWATFDRAAVENGLRLNLALNNQLRQISLSRRQDFLSGNTRDGNLRFEIRAIEFGVAELKIFDVPSNTLKNVLYGN